MKKNNWIFIICLITQIGVSQTTETIATGDNFGEITVIGNALYRGGQEATVVTYDLSTTSFDANTIATGPGSNPHLRFAVNPSEENVYLSEFGGPIFAADVSENNLTLIAQGMTTGGEVLGMAISGNTVYYSTSAPQILRFQMNDPDSTQEVFFDPASVSPILNMIINGDLLYYSTQSDFNDPEFQIFSLDITETPPVPQLVTTTSERAWSFAIEGDELYIASDQNNSVYLKNLSDGTTDAAVVLQELSLGTSTNIYSIDVEDNFLYFSATGNDGGIFRIATENLSITSNELSELTLFPNPSDQFLNVKGIHTSTSYTILSMSGKTIKTGFIDSDAPIDVSALSSGVYFINVTRKTPSIFIKR